ncbi:flagellar biosynthetic protein FliR [Persicimonas caeni]|uniref:Flagellar biosynthetic protein FliR n=1 Tax=Persicimonas caeni TaxID=2292766 RepID=A0A4Y6PSY1_PERCE|nr:flagellar biosynthetic protein FliR [Persicimonas caeni]QDG51360.1 flagellar biosynthetic protein FliR [Persicimonas caeni]QED32581.1 flagellar biosynthetic protein FliR [Persicimonas caeni]
MNELSALLFAADGYILGGAAVMMRLLGVLSGTPLGTNSAVPPRVRALLALHLTLVMCWALGFPHLPPEAGIAAWLAVLAPEFILGLAMGLMVRVIMAFATGMGQMASYSMGLGFASFVDPSTGASTTVISRILKVIGLLVFFAVDAHLHIISAVFDTFRMLPPGSVAMTTVSRLDMAHLGSQFFSVSLRLAAPVMAAGLMVYVVLAVMAKVAPQMNLFAFGFALTIPAGMIMLYFTMPSFAALMSDQLLDVANQMRMLVAN